MSSDAASTCLARGNAHARDGQPAAAAEAYRAGPRFFALLAALSS